MHARTHSLTQPQTNGRVTISPPTLFQGDKKPSVNILKAFHVFNLFYHIIELSHCPQVNNAIMEAICFHSYQSEYMTEMKKTREKSKILVILAKIRRKWGLISTMYKNQDSLCINMPAGPLHTYITQTTYVPALYTRIYGWQSSPCHSTSL